MTAKYSPHNTPQDDANVDAALERVDRLLAGQKDRNPQQRQAMEHLINANAGIAQMSNRRANGLTGFETADRVSRFLKGKPPVEAILDKKPGTFMEDVAQKKDIELS